MRACQRNGICLEVEDITKCASDQGGLESFIIEDITGGYLREDALEKLLEAVVAYFEKCLVSVEQLVSEFMNLLGIFKNLVFRSKTQKHLARGHFEASYASFTQEDIIVKQDPIMYFGDL